MTGSTQGIQETTHGRRIAVIGLGYVGLPVAVAFARTGAPVIGFDVSKRRILELGRGRDRTGEVDAEELRNADLRCSDDPSVLRDADFFIVTVPTPVTETRRPDLGAVLAASETVGRALKKGDIVVYESTVYPGATEEVCVPALESASGLRCGTDFSVGYSPERINPGDKAHRLETVAKVASAQDAETLGIVARVYGTIVSAGVHLAPSIRAAEAAKVIENTQRDLNIALMNELSMIFHLLGIDSHDVLAAARTKWNFVPFTPGLVGGHCIGVDPYYLTHKAEQVGYHPQVILAGRRINDGMGRFVAGETIKLLMRNGSALPPQVAILGLTFKENVPDCRNSRVPDVAAEFRSFGARVEIHDPMADAEDVRAEFGLDLVSLEAIRPADAVVLAVPHRSYVEGGWALVSRLLKNGRGVVADVRGCLDRAAKPQGVHLWRL
ncbi:MAG: nucleotide sugar dehydrogenase [Proteobacteria bacterium]|nr:nucleotide sugar dehydrogenase [Pseudomonadota bacterium]